jgi:hypothetical protein
LRRLLSRLGYRCAQKNLAYPSAVARLCRYALGKFCLWPNASSSRSVDPEPLSSAFEIISGVVAALLGEFPHNLSKWSFVYGTLRKRRYLIERWAASFRDPRVAQAICICPGFIEWLGVGIRVSDLTNVNPA